MEQKRQCFTKICLISLGVLIGIFLAGGRNRQTRWVKGAAQLMAAVFTLTYIPAMAG